MKVKDGELSVRELHSWTRAVRPKSELIVVACSLLLSNSNLLHSATKTYDYHILIYRETIEHICRERNVLNAKIC